MLRPLLVVTTLLAGCSARESPPALVADTRFCASVRHVAPPALSEALAPLGPRLSTSTAVRVLEDGNAALLARAWLSGAAERSIDTQYFIFSADNVGLIAFDYLVRAAERGVRVRVLVDDMLVDADVQQLVALDAHEHLAIKVYNPTVNIGKSLSDKVANTVTDFRGVNQRMHDKTFVVDGVAAITGGRNVADEYFDFDHEFNFRDRDVLLLGAGARQVGASFERFWNDPLSVPIAKLVKPGAAADKGRVSHALHEYACNPDNFWPVVRREVEAAPDAFTRLLQAGGLPLVDGVRFISDQPGKNAGDAGLGGGGASTDALVELLREAEREVIIQTPYLITTDAARALFAQLMRRGVKLTIVTNSLASTDNLEAFSGYQRDRDALLSTGAEIFEWRPDGAVGKALMTSALVKSKRHAPTSSLHAKTMVVDGRTLVVGTFNLDPRSSNLNTECFAVIRSEPVAVSVRERMLRETRPDNAWPVTRASNPDAEAGYWKRANVLLRWLVPKSVL